MKTKRALPHLATRIFNTPLLIHPAKAEIILRALGDRIGLYFDDDAEVSEVESQEKCYRVDDGIALIPVYGTLVKRSSGMDALSGMTSYESLQEQIEEAYTDPDVKGIVLDVDSPGGEASGMFELADFLTSVKGSKPIYASANDSAYSAAYALASCADKLFVSQTGGVGSVGCYMLHADQSGYDQKMGVKYTYIYAGDHKVDGNPHEPLTQQAQAELQERVDRVRDMFVSLVAKNRGVSADAVLATQAGCFFAADSIPLLADAVGSLDDCIAALRAAVGAPDEDEPADSPDQLPPQMEVATSVEVPGFLSNLPAAGVGTRGYWASVWQSAAREHLQGSLYLGKSPADTVLNNETIALRSAPIIGNGTETAQITCCVAPYRALSCDLGGFVEEYQPGCFAESLASGDDVRVLYNHNRDYVLGRKSARTATFRDTDEGLCFECTPPDTQWAKDLLVSMERGDITQGSAAFWIVKARWETRNGQKVRVIEKARLLECSVTGFAAYQTSHSAVQKSTETAANTFQHQNELLGARLRLLAL